MDFFRISRIINISPELKQCYRRYEALVFGLLRKKNQRHFVQECVKEQLIPKMYGFRRWFKPTEPFPVSARIFLEERINYVKQELYLTRRDINDTCNNLRFLCPDDDTFNYLRRFVYHRAIRGSISHQNSLRNKMKRLISSSVWNNMGNNDNILNLSTRLLTRCEQIVLNLGVSFALKPGKECYLDYVANFDKYCARRNYEKSDMCLKGLILSGIETGIDNNPLPDRLIKAITSLKKCDDIIISKSDKDGKIVIMDKELYITKAMELLNDDSTYEKLTRNPSDNVPREFYKNVRRIGGNKRCREILEKFKCFNPKLPYFYGNAKTHKEGIPLRPIISNRGSFMYKMSKMLADLLSPFLGNFSTSHIKHSEDFISKFNSSNIPVNNVRLLSLDVESLFTKVPINDVLAFLSDKLEPYDDHFPLGLRKTIDLIKLCISNNVFSFNGNYYRQKFGCSMGNPLSPILANLYMEYYETVLLTPIKPPDMVWYRYVDDIFTYWDDSWGNFEEFLDRLNSLVPSIKFKCEWERENCLPFLDILIMRSNNKYVFKVYRKPTFSISYIHYLSYHHDKIKIGVACNLFLRALRICSPEFYDEEFNVIRQQLSYLYYPRFVIEKSISKARYIYYRGKKENEFQGNKDKMVIPYSRNIDNNVNILGKDSPIVFSYPRTVGSALINVYQKTRDVTAGVYQIPCKDCDKSYYGQTGRSLDKRIYEHKQAVRHARNNSAIFQHIANEGHRIGWKDSSLIYSSSCVYKRKIIEAAVIGRKVNMNLAQGQWAPDIIDKFLISPTINKIIPPEEHRPPDRLNPP